MRWTPTKFVPCPLNDKQKQNRLPVCKDWQYHATNDGNFFVTSCSKKMKIELKEQRFKDTAETQAEMQAMQCWTTLPNRSFRDASSSRGRGNGPNT